MTPLERWIDKALIHYQGGISVWNLAWDYKGVKYSAQFEQFDSWYALRNALNAFVLKHHSKQIRESLNEFQIKDCSDTS